MTEYTAINHQVFTDDAKVFCVCQNHVDAMRIASAMNWCNEIDNSPYFNWAINIIKQIPIQNFLHADRYDTDVEYVIHMWNDNGESFDFRCPKEDFVGIREKKPDENQ